MIFLYYLPCRMKQGRTSRHAMFAEAKLLKFSLKQKNIAIFWGRMTKKYTLEAPSKRKYHRDGRLSKAEVMLCSLR